MEVYPSISFAQAAHDYIGTNADRGQPGINLFTQPVTVKPGFAGQCNATLVASRKGLHFESGYNLYARQSEKIKLKYPWIEQAALVSEDEQGFTKILANISFDASAFRRFDIDEYSKAVIRKRDLDLSSAEHPNMVVHQLYCNFGTQGEGDGKCTPLCGCGVAYDFAAGNSGMTRLSYWIKLGVSY